MKFTYKAASVRISRRNVIHAAYAGPMCLPGVMALSKTANDVIRQEPKVVDVTRALFCFRESASVDELANLGESEFGAIVCRPDQMEITRAFCLLASELEVVRVAFLDPEHALEWISHFV